MADVSGSSGTGGAPGGGEQSPSGEGDQPTGDMCVVCFDPNNETTGCYSTACPQHVLHKDCLFPWLSIKRSCPTCRTRVTNLLMKSGEAVDLPPLDRRAQLREENELRYAELRARFLQLGRMVPDYLQEALENFSYESDSDDPASGSSELRSHIVRRLEEIANDDGSDSSSDSSSDSDSSLSDINDDQTGRPIELQPPQPIESGVNPSADRVANVDDISARERRWQEWQREALDEMDFYHPASGCLSRLRYRINRRIARLRTGDSSSSSSSSEDGDNDQLEEEGTSERRRRDERAVLPDKVVRAIGSEERAGGEDDREGGGDSSEKNDGEEESVSTIPDNQPPQPTEPGVNQPLDSPVNRNDITSERLRQEETYERRRRGWDRVWGPFEQVVWASVPEERARGEEDRDGGGDSSECSDEPCSSTMRQRIVRRKRVKRSSDKDEDVKKGRRV